MPAVLDRPDPLAVQAARLPATRRSPWRRPGPSLAHPLAGRRWTAAIVCGACQRPPRARSSPGSPPPGWSHPRTRLPVGAATLLSVTPDIPRSATSDTAKLVSPRRPTAWTESLAGGPGPSPRHRTSPTPRSPTASLKASTRSRSDGLLCKPGRWRPSAGRRRCRWEGTSSPVAGSSACGGNLSWWLIFRLMDGVLRSACDDLSHLASSTRTRARRLRSSPACWLRGHELESQCECSARCAR